MTVNYEEFKKEQLKDPKLRKEYDSLDVLRVDKNYLLLESKHWEDLSFKRPLTGDELEKQYNVRRILIDIERQERELSEAKNGS